MPYTVRATQEQHIRERLLQLFSVSSPAAENHRETAGSYLRRFLSSPQVSTGSPLQFVRQDICSGSNGSSRSNGHDLSTFPAYLEFLSRSVIAESSNTSSPRCIGHMTSVVPGFMWTLTELVIGLNQNLVKREASRSLTILERQALSTLHRAVYDCEEEFYTRHAHHDASTLGILNSGATTSNITALWIARNASLGRNGQQARVENTGLPSALEHHGCRRAVIICSSFAHYSIQKAAGILGIGEHNVLTVGVDRNGRMDLRDLENTVETCAREGDRIIAIVGTAGTTDCGSIDPLGAIGAIARAADVHFHVDAAWGAPLLFSDRLREKLAGIELADSVTIDGHKQFYLPIGNGILLVRDPLASKLIEKQTRYMLQEDSGDLGKRSLEGSRPGWALLLDAGLQIIGPQGYGLLVEDNIHKARLLSSKLQEMPAFELLIPPEMNIVLYRYISPQLRLAASEGTLTFADNSALNDLNERLQKAQSEAGRSFVSRTTLENFDHGSPVVALRAVLGNPLTTESDIDFVLADQLEIAGQLSQELFCCAAAGAVMREPLTSIVERFPDE
jgi:putative pyridoxal-dependent aspartate 1-decarboxylase